jgi:hypothetical protein
MNKRALVAGALLAFAVAAIYFATRIDESRSSALDIRSLSDYQALHDEINRRARGGDPEASPSAFREYDLNELGKIAKDLAPAYYGDLNIYDPANADLSPAVVENMQGVVAIMLKSQLDEEARPVKLVQPLVASETEALCSNELLAMDYAAAFCSGFLVDRDLVMTASHCFLENFSSTIRFVFGFVNEKAKEPRLTFDPDDIRQARLVYRSNPCDDDDPDIAVYQLTQPVTHRVPILTTEAVNQGDELYMLGCPLGVSIRYSSNAKVLDNTPATYFVANLDGYNRNSGSPVFRADHRVVGMHVEGEKALYKTKQWLRTCWASTVCPEDGAGCRGEYVTRSSLFPLQEIRENVRRIAAGESVSIPNGHCPRFKSLAVKRHEVLTQSTTFQ